VHESGPTNVAHPNRILEPLSLRLLILPNGHPRPFFPQARALACLSLPTNGQRPNGASHFAGLC